MTWAVEDRVNIGRKKWIKHDILKVNKGSNAEIFSPIGTFVDARR
jgi:hypothetical protein